MPRTSNGTLTESGVATVSLDASGNGSAALTFAEPFVGPPDVLVQTRRGDAGTYAAASVTATGCSVSVSGSDIRSESVAVAWVAMEKA